MIQGFCFGVIFILSFADLIYKVREFEVIDSNNAICLGFSLIGVVSSVW